MIDRADDLPVTRQCELLEVQYLVCDLLEIIRFRTGLLP